MNKKYTSYVLLGVLATFVLLLSTSPTLANPSTNGLITISSTPNGADVYVLFGPNEGKYLGTTPFTYDPSGGTVWVKFVKPGYQTSMAPIYSWYPQYTNMINAILTPI